MIPARNSSPEIEMASRGTSRVKNRQPAPVQITAEQILQEAWDRREPEYVPPKQRIHDVDELKDYQMRKRKVSAVYSSVHGDICLFLSEHTFFVSHADTVLTGV